jgi:adenine-specific DNA-methyltransferase
MAKKLATRAATKIESVKHKDTRKNIPTEELRDFVEEQEQKPTTVLYPRDPSLDPQLVWKGKDEQDRADLAVPAVPIYIQEKIHPQAIIEDFRRQAAKVETTQPDLFGDFNGLNDFEKKVDFYHHDQHWSNRMILGDSLLVMTSLAEKEGMKGKVQMIYFDPPYGIGFRSNWQVSTRNRDIKDGKAEDATRQPEQIRAFRDTWKMGIHSYLSYLRDRLTAARDLLTESGSIFVQIGDENVHLVRNLLDEVFGPQSFQAQINFKSTSALGQKGLAQAYDYIIWYAKNPEQVKFRELFKQRDISDDREWRFLDDPTSPTGYRKLTDEEFAALRSYKGIFRRAKLTSSGFTPSCIYSFTLLGVECKAFGGKSWATNRAGMETLIRQNRLFLISDNPYMKQYYDDFPVSNLDNSWTDQPGAESRVYVVQTAEKFIQRCLLMTTDPGDLVLDPTCGSGTTAVVAEQWGRRWITTDTSRVAVALARTRLMTGRYPYYLLNDSPEGVKKEAELTGKTPPPYKTDGDIRKGFVYQRVPHVTLKSIANNPDIRDGMTRKQIDEAIARHADSETLFDKPFDDKSRLRVAGPFTVESLSPHRTISVEDKKTLSETGKDGWKVKLIGPSDFSQTILENLKKAGVQNTVKNERLKFDSLEPYAGEWIQGEGRYTDSDGKERRAAICIGPEHGTVGPQLVKEAAKEAVRGVGFDILIVCGFAFDPHVTEEAKRYGKLTVLSARMNPDLAMGDELLKKTGAGNLFMVFGEPDLTVETQKDGKLIVEIKGLDVYDPTTGAIRSNTTDDIACWFIDTDYNGESFFVRHAYFTGADEPYEKLKNALRAEIDEAAWSSLYATRSRPFDKPETGKIAVKVINHYGDEVLKVYSTAKAK